jgi:hypothetical protein
MNFEPAVPRLEALRKTIQAARNTPHAHNSRFLDGLNAGLQLALNQIEQELRWTKELEAAIAAVKQ